MDTTTAALPPKAAPLVEQLIAVGGQLQTLLTHMEHAAAANGAALEAGSIHDVLAELLGAVLAPLARRRPEDCAITAALLEEVGATIASELFLVPLDPDADPEPAA